MVQVKKASKYGKYFLFLAVASAVAFIWPSKDSSNSVLPAIPHAQADVPVVDDGGDGGDGGGCP